MNYMLDTHTFLWFINDDSSLSSTAKTLIENRENAIYLSIASIWEMAIKVSLGRLETPSPFTDFIDEQLSKKTIVLLDIRTAHTGIVATLPFYHHDPFDRLIIAQSQGEDFPIIGRDMVFDEYGIERHW
jgi:PIN domain nuclease of toxin-antitoxin system